MSSYYSLYIKKYYLLLIFLYFPTQFKTVYDFGLSGHPVELNSCKYTWVIM